MKWTIRFAILSVCLSALADLAGAQTVADVARQERERRQKTKSTIVITNSSLKPATPPQPAEETAAAPEEKKEAAQPVAPGRDEKWWREAFSEARANVRRAEDQIRVLEIDLNRAKQDYLQRSDIYNRENRLNAEIAQINQKIDAARKDAEGARQRISQLEEELRRSGAPAGWAR
jgi:hypothetical protein